MNAERLGMVWEKNRLKSFKKWPFSKKDPCNIQKMAEAGFFWTGNEVDADSAQCFVCNKVLDGWEAKDDPWKEHASHAPTCPFVKIGQPELHLTVSQFLDLRTTMVKNVVTCVYEQVKTRWAVEVMEIKENI